MKFQASACWWVSDGLINGYILSVNMLGVFYWAECVLWREVMIPSDMLLSLQESCLEVVLEFILVQQNFRFLSGSASSIYVA